MEARWAPRQKVFFGGQVFDAFNAQYPILKVCPTTAFHGRCLILDGAEGYLVGASLKDAGKKGFAVVRIEDPVAIKNILGRLAMP